MIDHVGIYGSRVAEGLSAFNVGLVEIKVVLISCSLSKVASKAVENNGLIALMSTHSVPCWAVPWKEWGIQQTVKATSYKGSQSG